MMKGIAFTLFIVLLSLAASNLHAQEKTNGIRAGYLMSNVNGIEPSPNALHGFYAGFYHDRPIGDSKILWINGGTEYTQAGWSYDENNFQRLHYISLPGALKVKFGPVFLQGGFNLNFKVGETILVDGEDAKTDENKSKFFNFPLHAGLGVMLGPLTIDARYHYGLSNLNDTENNIAYLQVGAGFHF